MISRVSGLRAGSRGSHTTIVPPGAITRCASDTAQITSSGPGIPDSTVKRRGWCRRDPRGQHRQGGPAQLPTNRPVARVPGSPGLAAAGIGTVGGEHPAQPVTLIGLHRPHGGVYVGAMALGMLLVRNAVTHDARVLRAAGVLREAGYEVEIMGVVSGARGIGGRSGSPESR